mmetsp:Transcript_8755/g.14854  ORF Transcript_8755/g.14854 Transcript_8755/m.14854 type:complete len:114 (+) Transcript_8755:3155-3496(+)
MLERKRKTQTLKEINKRGGDIVGINDFHTVYLNDLSKQQYAPQREIDPEVFKPKLQRRQGPSEKFLSNKERIDKLYDDLYEFRENKLEDKQRVQLYYVLQKMYEQQQEGHTED